MRPALPPPGGMGCKALGIHRFENDTSAKSRGTRDTTATLLGSFSSPRPRGTAEGTRGRGRARSKGGVTVSLEPPPHPE